MITEPSQHELFKNAGLEPVGITGWDILSVDQFEPDLLERLFSLAQFMRDTTNASRQQRQQLLKVLEGYVLTCLFYEPSTRTSSSFISAMERLGGSIIPITQGVQYSSVSKGETLRDTGITLAQYGDAVVLRHPEIGASARMAQRLQGSGVPVINAGDGPGEHPTQALLDLFTIMDEMGTINGLKVALVGDLRFGRTVHSLTKLLLPYEVSFRFVSPEILRLPLKIMNQVIDARGGNGNGLVRETHNLEEVIATADVVYMTRVQEERFTDRAQYEEVRNAVVLTPELMKRAKEQMIVMHPLPRKGEIPEEIDADPRSAYVRQVKNGLWVRMAILAAALGAA